MSIRQCATYGMGVCQQCCELITFRYKANMHFRMWQRASYRDVPRVPWGTMRAEGTRAALLGQVRIQCVFRAP